MVKNSATVLRSIFELGSSEMSAVGNTGLSGQRIVVTRASPQAAPLIAALKANAAIVTALPLLEIVDAADDGEALRNALAQLTTSDWLVVLSPNGARRIVDFALPAGRPRLAVIAGGTGQVFGEAGWPADLVPEVASSLGLLDAFANVSIEGKVLIAQAEVGRTELADGLTVRGVDVEVVAAYRNVLPKLDPATASAAVEADAVVFASPSAVERYVANVGRTPNRAVCIGSVTAKTAIAAGFDVSTCVAPTVEAIVALLTTLAALPE